MTGWSSVAGEMRTIVPRTGRVGRWPSRARTGAPTARSSRSLSETGSSATSFEQSATSRRGRPAMTKSPTRSAGRAVSTRPTIGLLIESRFCSTTAISRPAAAAVRSPSASATAHASPAWRAALSRPAIRALSAENRADSAWAAGLTIRRSSAPAATLSPSDTRTRSTTPSPGASTWMTPAGRRIASLRIVRRARGSMSKTSRIAPATARALRLRALMISSFLSR